MKHVGVRSWAEWFRALGIFDEVFLFADCCRHFEDLVPPITPFVPNWKPQRPEGRQFYAFSTKFASTAWEKELGNPPRKRGILSFVVTEALKNPKLYNEKNELTADSLEDHLYKRVPELANNQEPIIEYPHKPEGLIVANWVERKKQSVQISFSSSYAGATAEIFFGGELKKPLESHVIDGCPWIQELDAEYLYKVTIKGTDDKLFIETKAIDGVQNVTL